MFDQNLQQLIDFYLEVKSITLVSDKFGLSKSKVYRVLKENNVDTTIDRVKAGERIRKYELDPYYFSEIDTRDKAYITGMLHSDGCITRGSEQVRIKLTDLDLIEEINSKIYKDRPLYSDSSTKKGHKKNGLLVITHPQVYSDVQKHGCCLDKTYNLEFPTTIPNELMGDYFRGFFDGDGCIYVNEKLNYKPATITIVATRKWVRGAIVWLDKIGIRATEYDDKRHDNRITRLTLLDVYSQQRFYNLLYTNLDGQIYLKRKFEKYKDSMELRKVYDTKQRDINKDEIFKPVPGFPGYEAGTFGNIKSAKYDYDTYILRPYYNKYGTPIVSFSQDNKSVKVYLCNIIALTFLEETDLSKHKIKHLDTNILNNKPENLILIPKYKNGFKA